jgi:hypothetical protein
MLFTKKELYQLPKEYQIVDESVKEIIVKLDASEISVQLNNYIVHPSKWKDFYQTHLQFHFVKQADDLYKLIELSFIPDWQGVEFLKGKKDIFKGNLQILDALNKAMPTPKFNWHILKTELETYSYPESIWGVPIRHCILQVCDYIDLAYIEGSSCGLLFARLHDPHIQIHSNATFVVNYHQIYTTFDDAFIAFEESLKTVRLSHLLKT